MSVSEHMLSQATSSYQNCMFKIKIFVFRKKHVAQISYQSHLLALHTVEILYNLILRNHWTWTWQISDYLNGLGLILWYTELEHLTGLRLILLYLGVRLEKYSD